MRNSIFAVICLLLVMAACTRKEPAKPQPITRLDRALAEYKDLDSLGRMALADSLHDEISSMFAVMNRPQVSPGLLLWWSESEVVDAFQPVVDSVFPDLSLQQQQLGEILRNAATEGLQIPDLDYVAVTWANPRPIVRDSSTVLIALNHFLGADFEGYSHWDEYRRVAKTPEVLPYTLANVLVCTQYPFAPVENPTLLNWMLYEGAAMEATMRLVENADAAPAMGWTPEQLEYAQKHEKMMWNDLAAMRLLYDTDPRTLNRMISFAPSTPMLGGNAPGRSGRFLGWKIVRAYLDSHPDATLTDVLSPSFYLSPTALQDSGYK